MINHESGFQDAAELIAEAEALIIAAGAGMGVNSGLPDFRGKATQQKVVETWLVLPVAGADLSITKRYPKKLPFRR